MDQAEATWYRNLMWLEPKMAHCHQHYVPKYHVNGEDNLVNRVNEINSKESDEIAYILLLNPMFGHHNRGPKAGP